jgi:3-dehydroquinate dehydratase II
VKKMMMLHGINHNMFGKRDLVQYGLVTLEQINEKINELANELGVWVETFQTNHEGEMVDKIHQAFNEGYDAVLFNPGAWTHYSYGIRDALEILTVPIIEIHMSNIYKREEFRHQSVFADIVTGQISGFGVESYLLALRAAAAVVKEKKEQTSLHSFIQAEIGQV